jgi:hypothetical protein
MAATSEKISPIITIPSLPPVCILSKNYEKLSDKEVSKTVQFYFQALKELINSGDKNAFIRSGDGWHVLSVLRMLNPTESTPLLLELITLVFEKQLLNAQPRASYEYLTAHVQDKKLLSSIARPYFQALSDPCQILWFAIISGDADLAENAIRSGADVNALLHVGMSPLLLACKQGNYALVKLLIAKGANPRFIGGTHDHETPVTELRHHSEAWVIELFKPEDIAFSNEFENRKILTHLSSAKGALIEHSSTLGDHTFYTEGERPRLFLQQLLKCQQMIESAIGEMHSRVGTFYESTTKELSEQDKLLIEGNSELRAALSDAMISLIPTFAHYLQFEILERYRHIDEAMSDALQRLKRNEPVICFGTTKNPGTWNRGAPNLHAWGLVISRDPAPESKGYLVQRIDRGIVNSGITTLSITEAEAIEFISDYLQASNWKSYPKDSENIQKSIHAKFDSFLKTAPASLLSLPAQQAGVCCMTSFEGVVLAYLRAQFALSVDFSTASLLAKGFAERLFQEILAKNIVDYLEEHFSESSASLMPPDLEILEKAVFIMQSIDPLPSTYHPKILSAIQQKSIQPVQAFPENIFAVTKQPYIEYLFKTLQVKLIFNNKTEFSKIITTLTLRLLLKNTSVYRSGKELNFDSPILFTKDNIGTVGAIIDHFRSFRREITMHPPKDSLADLYFFLLDMNAEAITEEEFLKRFDHLSPDNQELILSFPPFYNETGSLSFDLMFAAVHNAIFAKYASLSNYDHHDQIHEIIFKIKADSLLTAFHRMPDPYKVLFRFQLKTEGIPPLEESTAIFSEGSKLHRLIQGVHCPPGWLFNLISGLDFSQGDPLFYLQLFNDPEYFLMYQSAGTSTKMECRNPARLALALSLLKN